MNQSLRNLNVLITGASSGIGAACARAFAKQGANLILCARRIERLNQLSNELQDQYSISVNAIALDVSDRQAVIELVAQLNSPWNQIDILINNAGLALGLESFQHGDLDQWEQMVQVNVMGLLYMSRAIVPLMLARNRGHIINIGSIAGRAAYPNGAIYCGTKSAVRTITDGLRMDVVSSNIRISNIEPGMVETDFSLVRFSGDEKRAKQVYQNIEALQAEDIADIAVFMADRPPHVQICDIMVTPTHQASAAVIHRQN